MLTTIIAAILDFCEHLQAPLQHFGKKHRFKSWPSCILVCNKTSVNKFFYVFFKCITRNSNMIKIGYFSSNYRK